MNNKLKIIFLLAAILAISVLNIPPALADDDSETIKPSKKLGIVGEHAGFGDNQDNLPEIVGGIIQTFLAIIGIIFMAYTVYAGYLWMSAKGEEEKIIKAKAIIKGSIIGIIVVFAAYAITYFVVDKITETTEYTSTQTE